MDCAKKILTLPQLLLWREQVKRSGDTLVATNGCFDLLHAGHVNYLEAARNLGRHLLVGVNSDEAVRQLKGPGRPLNTESDRALVLAALESVSAVYIFPELRATQFLLAARPDIYVKGGDYTLETLDPEERAAVESAGGRIHLIPFLAGRSTTGLIQRMTHHAPG